MRKREVWLLALALAAAGPTGCVEPRSDFLARVAEDCKAGDPAACSLLRAPPDSSAFEGVPGGRADLRTLVQQDMEALIRGMEQANANLHPRLRDGAR